MFNFSLGYNFVEVKIRDFQKLALRIFTSTSLVICAKVIENFTQLKERMAKQRIGSFDVISKKIAPIAVVLFVLSIEYNILKQ